MPGQICSVAVCKTSFYKEKRKDQKVLFFTFPKDPILKDIWISRCYREGAFNVKCARICSKHFTNDDYEDVMRAKLMNEHPKRLKSTGRLSTLFKTMKRKLMPFVFIQYSRTHTKLETSRNRFRRGFYRTE